MVEEIGSRTRHGYQTTFLSNEIVNIFFGSYVDNLSSSELEQQEAPKVKREANTLVERSAFDEEDKDAETGPKLTGT